MLLNGSKTCRWNQQKALSSGQETERTVERGLERPRLADLASERVDDSAELAILLRQRTQAVDNL